MKLNIFSKKEEKTKKPKKSSSDTTAVLDAPAEPTKSSGGVSSNTAGTSVIEHIYTSEKSTRLIELNQYVFKVKKNANKNEIKKEIAVRYNVKVKDVKVMNVLGKRRDIGRHPGFRPGYRKAIVVLHPGSEIQQAKQ